MPHIRRPPPRVPRPADRLLEARNLRETFLRRPSSNLRTLPEDQQRLAEQSREDTELASSNRFKLAQERATSNASRLEGFASSPQSFRFGPGAERQFLDRGNTRIDAQNLRSVLGGGQKLNQQVRPSVTTQPSRIDQTQETDVPQQEDLQGSGALAELQRIRRRNAIEEAREQGAAIRRSQLAQVAQGEEFRETDRGTRAAGTLEGQLSIARAPQEAAGGQNLALESLRARGRQADIGESAFQQRSTQAAGARQAQELERVRAEVKPFGTSTIPAAIRDVGQTGGGSEVSQNILRRFSDITGLPSPSFEPSGGGITETFAAGAREGQASPAVEAPPVTPLTPQAPPVGDDQLIQAMQEKGFDVAGLLPEDLEEIRNNPELLRELGF